jgi:hypothetical protein
VRQAEVYLSHAGWMTRPDVTAWRMLRQALDYRREGRRNQLRFPRDPQTYLPSLEERLYRSGLPSSFFLFSGKWAVWWSIRLDILINRIYTRSRIQP